VSRAESLNESVLSVLKTASEVGELLEIYVGIPINLQGESTQSTQDAVEFAHALEDVSQVDVRLIDERLTTSMANNQLKQIGKSQKDARSTIDQMAAVAILEFALSVERNKGLAPGLSIEQWRQSNE
jgi:putative Holliday junction resolvase